LTNGTGNRQNEPGTGADGTLFSKWLEFGLFFGLQFFLAARNGWTCSLFFDEVLGGYVAGHWFNSL
jgi:hypothetical protein